MISSLSGGRIHDPAHGKNGVVADIFIEDGRIVAPPEGGRADNRCDLRASAQQPAGVAEAFRPAFEVSGAARSGPLHHEASRGSA